LKIRELKIRELKIRELKIRELKVTELNAVELEGLWTDEAVAFAKRAGCNAKVLSRPLSGTLKLFPGPLTHFGSHNTQ